MNRPTIEIVTHCWCPPGLAFYAQHLKWQMCSLAASSVADQIQLSVCLSGDDQHTSNIIDQSLRGYSCFGSLRLQVYPLSKEHLFRRAYGRNLACRHSDADVVWLTDADYFFGGQSIESVLSQMDAGSGLCMPSKLNISVDHATGQQMIESQWNTWPPKYSEGMFARRRQRICIGGCQIIGGDFARRHGYLDGTAWVEPVDPSSGFRSCKCDVAFRRYYKERDGRPIQRLAIPNVYRIRHTADGRDYALDGTKGECKQYWA